MNVGYQVLLSDISERLEMWLLMMSLPAMSFGDRFCMSRNGKTEGGGWVHPKGSLVPRPRPAFCCLQYVKVGRAWYLFSREHDVIDKWQKNSERKSEVSGSVQQTTSSTLGVYNIHPLLATYMW